jgi:hypothetical protein
MRIRAFYNITGAFNDQAASLRVPTGWSAMLYQDANRGGGKVCYNTNVANLANEGNFPGHQCRDQQTGIIDRGIRQPKLLGKSCA